MLVVRPTNSFISFSKIFKEERSAQYCAVGSRKCCYRCSRFISHIRGKYTTTLTRDSCKITCNLSSSNEPVELKGSRSWDALKKWMDLNGAYINSIDVKYVQDIILIDNQLRGIAPTRKFYLDEQIIAVPSSLVISDRKAQQHEKLSLLFSELNTQGVHVTQAIILACWFMHERMVDRLNRLSPSSQYQASFFRPYLRILPSWQELEMRAGPLCMWSTDELELFNNEYVTDYAMRERENMQMAYDLVVSEYWEQITGQPAPSIHEFIYNHAIATSRSIITSSDASSPSMLIAPLIDMVNHASNRREIRSCIVADYEHNVVLYTKKIINQDCQIHADFGVATNLELLMRYGFLLTYECKNKHEVILLYCKELLDKLPEAVAGFHVEDGSLEENRFKKINIWQPLTGNLETMLRSIAGEYFGLTGDKLLYKLLGDTLDYYERSSVKDQDQRMKCNIGSRRLKLAVEYRNHQIGCIEEKMTSLHKPDIRNMMTMGKKKTRKRFYRDW